MVFAMAPIQSSVRRSNSIFVRNAMLRKIMITRAILSAMLLALVSSALAAQTFPFPQNAAYSYGIRPAGHNHADALAAYNDWRSRYVVTDQASSYRRVFYD